MTIPKTKNQVEVKICGITNTRDLNNCLKLNFEYIGFNFVDRSPRCISFLEFEHILESSDIDICKSKPKIVSIVDPNTINLPKIFLSKAIDVLQLFEYPQESILSIDTNKEIWLQATQNTISDYDFSILKSVISKIVLDSPKTHDYTKPEFANTNKPLFESANEIIPTILAGGINPQNILEMILEFNPSIIDICSGVEISTTQKNYDALYEVSSICKQYNSKL
jgi:phosphoribosylanthranilate isomerase